MSDCQSCKDERKKKGLNPSIRIVLPKATTAEGFRRPDVLTVLCAYCDGETAVSAALRNHKTREDPPALT